MHGPKSQFPKSELHKTWHRTGRLERPQEVDDVLLLLRVQPVEMVDDFVRLALAALMIFDGLQQIVCPPVMHEKDPLPYAPERGCSELIGARGALRYAVGKISSHVVDEQVGPEMHCLVGKRGAGGR